MKERRNGKEYEKIVANIGNSLFKLAEKGNKFEVKNGARNKWIGISGFDHQIDVSVETNEYILLVECKNWGSEVDVPAFLTFLARVIDIRSKHSNTNKKTYGKIVTTVGYDSGVQTLADYYKIDLDQVKSERDFLLKFENYGVMGLTDQGTGTDHVNVNRQCSVCESLLILSTDKVSFVCPNCESG